LVYIKTKDELVEYTKEFGLEAKGRSEELRQRLAAYTRAPNAQKRSKRDFRS